MDFRPCPVPAGSALAEFRDSGDYLNASTMEVDLPEGVVVTAPVLARAAMERPNFAPDRLLPLVDALTRIQGVLFKPFGVEPNTHNRKRALPAMEVGNRFGPWQVYSVTEDEVLLGDVDPFWDFRVTFLVDGGTARLGVVLRARNKPGEIYYRMMKGLQQKMLRDSLRRGLELLIKQAAEGPAVEGTSGGAVPSKEGR